MKNFDDILEAVKPLPVRRVAVAVAQDRYLIEAAIEARKQNVAEAVLVGDEAEIRKISEEAVALAAAQVAGQIHAAAIITCTQSGSTTRLVSKQRPRIPLLALTPDKSTFRKMALVWGAIPLLMEPAAGVETMERQALQSAMHAGLVREGDVVVITAGLPLHVPGTTNTVKVAVAAQEPALKIGVRGAALQGEEQACAHPCEPTYKTKPSR